MHVIQVDIEIASRKVQKLRKSQEEKKLIWKMSAFTLPDLRFLLFSSYMVMSVV